MRFIFPRRGKYRLESISAASEKATDLKLIIIEAIVK